MKCSDALDSFYEEDTLRFGRRLGLAFHIIFCKSCAGRLNMYEEARSILHTGFFPPSPDFTNSIMDCIYEDAFEDEIHGHESGGFSVRGWIIAGVVLLMSLATVFLNQDFTGIAMEQGSSFLLPIGIITGIVITGYGALFIGSHLKEFSERFKL